MIEQIKKLREQTGAPLDKIRQALEQADGDATKAKRLLVDYGKQAAAKRSGRQASAGLVEAYSHLGKIGVVVEVNCETDFVSKNDTFSRFVHDLALQIAATNPKDVKELVSQPFVKDETKTVGDLIAEVTGKLGEKIVVKRFSRYELGGRN